MVKMKEKKEKNKSHQIYLGVEGERGRWVSPKISPTKHFSHPKSLIFSLQPNITLVSLGCVYICTHRVQKTLCPFKNTKRDIIPYYCFYIICFQGMLHSQHFYNNFTTPISCNLEYVVKLLCPQLYSLTNYSYL